MYNNQSGYKNLYNKRGRDFMENLKTAILIIGFIVVQIGFIPFGFWIYFSSLRNKKKACLWIMIALSFVYAGNILVLISGNGSIMLAIISLLVLLIAIHDYQRMK